MEIHILCPFKTGDIVGAGRWPNPLSEHSPPWKGTVLAINDPRSWQGSLALGDNPTQASVDAHVAWCRDYNLSFLFDSLPVLWDFSDRQQVYWTRWGEASRYALRFYEQDVSLWQNALKKDRIAIHRAA